MCSDFNKCITSILIIYFFFLIFFFKFHCVLCLQILLLYFLLLYHPIKDIVIFIAHFIEEVFEKFSQIPIVGSFIKLKVAAVLHENAKLFWITITDLLYSTLQFFLFYTVILLFLVVCSQTLPR